MWAAGIDVATFIAIVACIGGAIGTTIAVLSFKASRAAAKAAKEVADRAQQIDGVQISLESLTVALAQANSDLRDERAAHVVTRKELRQLRDDFDEYRRVHHD